MDAILHVVRCFEDDNIVHVDGSIDPLRDMEVISMELILADLDTVDRRLVKSRNQAKSGDKKLLAEVAFLEQVRAMLDQENRPPGEPGKRAATGPLRELCLLTTKPVLYVANVNEGDLATGNPYVEQLARAAAGESASLVMIAGAIEQELSLLDPAEQREFLRDMGMEEPGLHRLIKAGYELLGLITFFTVGEKETRPGPSKRDQGTGCGRQDSFRFRTRLHPRRGHCLCRLYCLRLGVRCPGQGADAFGRQGICGSRRRLHPLSPLMFERGWHIDSPCQTPPILNGRFRA